MTYSLRAKRQPDAPSTISRFQWFSLSLGVTEITESGQAKQLKGAIGYQS